MMKTLLPSTAGKGRLQQGFPGTYLGIVQVGHSRDSRQSRSPDRGNISATENNRLRKELGAERGERFSLEGCWAASTSWMGAIWKGVARRLT